MTRQRSPSLVRPSAPTAERRAALRDLRERVPRDPRGLRDLRERVPRDPRGRAVALAFSRQPKRALSRPGAVVREHLRSRRAVSWDYSGIVLGHIFGRTQQSAIISAEELGQPELTLIIMI